ncbi:MAG: hypothetical protein ACOX7U_07155 [Desulfitobacteriia bacterium]|jgi:hypothetical protein
MEVNEYTYRMKPLILPGLGFIILYPLLAGSASYFLSLAREYLILLSAIYVIAVFIIFLVWIVAKSQRILINKDQIIFRSLWGRKIIEPQEIKKASFMWTKNNDEIVFIKTGKKTFCLSNLYFPFNELLTDLEELIITHNIRSNLASHYGLN